MQDDHWSILKRSMPFFWLIDHNIFSTLHHWNVEFKFYSKDLVIIYVYFLLTNLVLFVILQNFISVSTHPYHSSHDYDYGSKEAWSEMDISLWAIASIFFLCNYLIF